MARGKMLMVRRTEAIRPVQARAVRAWLLLENQSRVGAYQKRARPTELVTARRYSEAGRIPLEPMRPRIWKMSEKKAEKWIRPSARRKSQRGRRRSRAPWSGSKTVRRMKAGRRSIGRFQYTG